MAGRDVFKNALITFAVVLACVAAGLWPVNDSTHVHAQGGTINSGGAAGPTGPTGAAGQMNRTDVTVSNPASLGTSSGTATTLVAAQGANNAILPVQITLNQLGTPLWTNVGSNQLSFFEAFDIFDWSGIVSLGAANTTYFSQAPLLTFAGFFAGSDSFVMNKPLTVYTDSTITGTGGAWHFTIYWLLYTGP